MKFAFSTVACPNWDFETIAARAKEYAYDGVEIRGFLNETVLSTSNIFLSDPAKVARTFAAAGIEIPCLSSSIAFTGHRKKDAASAADLRRFIDTAKILACPLVKIFDTNVHPGASRSQVAAAMAKWLNPLADYAVDNNISIVIENALSFRNAKEMWLLLEMLGHPAVGVCWDVFAAAMIGETPSVSVPMLNSRIEYTQVKDAKLGPLGALYTKLGEGDVAIQEFLNRLKGVGYNGYVTFEWEKAWLTNLAEPETVLPDAITKMREWTKPQEEEQKKPPKKPAAAAAH